MDSVHNVDTFWFAMIVFITVAFLVMLFVGLLYLIPPTGNYLRKRFPQSTETVKNATLTCEHGHKVRVYINIPGPLTHGKMYNPRDHEFRVDPKHCPICGGHWRMPDKHRHKNP
jgi:hypothetical protein